MLQFDKYSFLKLLNFEPKHFGKIMTLEGFSGALYFLFSHPKLSYSDVQDLVEFDFKVKDIYLITVIMLVLVFSSFIKNIEFMSFEFAKSFTFWLLK